MDIYLALGAIGIFAIIILAILAGAWVERHGMPPAPIDWEGSDEK